MLDLCIVLAGPTCGRTLAEYGADVIKIDDPARPYDPSGSLDVNRGKRSILLDLKQEAGRQVFFDLLETADVVVENYRKGSLAKLGLDYDSLKQRKPEPGLCIVERLWLRTGHGANVPGWEQLAQATSGMQVRRGGRDDAPMLMPYPVNDYGTGMMGAYAVALALHERNRTGKGQSVDSGLALTAGLLQSPYFLDFDGHQRNEPEGRELRGIGLLCPDCTKPATVGFTCIARMSSARKGFFQIEELVHLSGHPESAAIKNGEPVQDGALAQGLAEVFREKPRSHWMACISGAGIGIAENMGISDFRNAGHVRDAGLIVTREHGAPEARRPPGQHGSSVGHAHALRLAHAGFGRGR